MKDDPDPRALRKQLLQARSAAERVELAQTVSAVRQSATVFRKDAPGLAMGKSLPLAWGLLKRAPLLSPLLCLAVSGARKPALRYAALAGGAAWLGWKGWQGWGARRAPSAARDDAAAAGEPESVTAPE